MKKLLTQILIELAHTPIDYKQPLASLRGAARMAISPSPSDLDIDNALLRAEEDDYIIRSTHVLRGACYIITPRGRELVREIGY